MSEVAIVRAMFEAFAVRDLDRALPLMHPEVEWRPYATADRAGRGKAYVGHEGIRQYFRDVDAVWTSFSATPEDYRAVAGAVVIFGRVVAVRPGEEIRTAVMWMWKLEDELVARGHVYPVGERRG